VNWLSAIEWNRAALLRLLGVLFAQAGIAPGAVVDRDMTLPRSVRLALLRLLRPAESAGRRLITVLAARVYATVPAPEIQHFRNGKKARGKLGLSSAFPLFDPRRSLKPTQRRRSRKTLPMIRFLDGRDPPYEAFEDDAPLSPDDEIDAARLCQRLQVLKAALEDLPKQARRLARAQARRQSIRKLRLASPLRVGRPPGHRDRATHEVDEILHECEILARRALVPPDTS